MSENQPREYDAVLGGGNQAPVDGVVLGGIEGVKRRLANSVADVRAIAITQAANYGIEGLDLIIEALNDCSGIVRGVAYKILKRKIKKLPKTDENRRIKEKLANFDKLKIFTTLDDWIVQDFNPDIGILDTEFIAYNVNSLEEFQSLLNSHKVSEVQALSLHIESDEINTAVDILLNNYKKLSTLRALCIAENTINGQHIKGNIDIGEVLKLYPCINLLKIKNVSNIIFSVVQHENLKTLIFNLSWLNSIDVQSVNCFKTPNLEYLYYSGNGFRAYESLTNLFSNICFKKIKYLAYKGTSYCDDIAHLLIYKQIINSLIGLDFSDSGSLTDKGANTLLRCSATYNLYYLNVNNNYLSPEMVKKLSKLKCKVIANSQYYSR
ncbi:MAG: hypothetical protein AAF757_25745 [Cyanobacteria bacterium P01_D01_bin.116]